MEREKSSGSERKRKKRAQWFLFVHSHTYKSDEAVLMCTHIYSDIFLFIKYSDMLLLGLCIYVTSDFMGIILSCSPQACLCSIFFLSKCLCSIKYTISWIISLFLWNFLYSVQGTLLTPFPLSHYPLYFVHSTNNIKWGTNNKLFYWAKAQKWYINIACVS